MIAALYVQTGGSYFGLPGVEPWDGARFPLIGESWDAREYDGPHPVVAHPPCKRWGRYWSGGPSARVRRELGDDGGCFAAALRLEQGGDTRTAEQARATRAAADYKPAERITSAECLATPAAFRDVLISMARSVDPQLGKMCVTDADPAEALIPTVSETETVANPVHGGPDRAR